MKNITPKFTVFIVNNETSKVEQIDGDVVIVQASTRQEGQAPKTAISSFSPRGALSDAGMFVWWSKVLPTHIAHLSLPKEVISEVKKIFDLLEPLHVAVMKYARQKASYSPQPAILQMVNRGFSKN